MAIPLKSEDGSKNSTQDEALDQIGNKILNGYCYDHEICYHSLTSGKSDLVEISPHLTGLTACTCHSGLVSSEPAGE